ncbi:MAG: DNA repair protein RecO [Xanthomonadales bacterium]|nr:DNA repair protein RecO [Xanthomonadales bacterium]MCE7932123.1 DNA repair protein RecO [Xanthomonadales bacterium PRO6]
MRVQEQAAFVLHRRQYSESSLLLELLTVDYGRVGCIARGARGVRNQASALLQAFQELALDWSGGGDLVRLVRAEAPQPILLLQGASALAGLYCNELLVRLLPRRDPHPHLYLRYRQTLQALADGGSLAWTLRRFERDLLRDLGYAADYASDASGAELDAQGRYRFEPEHGFVRVADSAPGYAGAALRALAGDRLPDATQLRELRRMLRELITLQLRGAPLRSWSLLTDLSR